MTNKTYIPIGENRLLDITDIWYIERFTSKKQLQSEVEELPRFISLYVIRLYIDKQDIKAYRMAYFVDEYECNRYWDWLKSLLKDKQFLVEPPGPSPFKRLSPEVSNLFFGHKIPAHRQNAQKEEKLHKQLAEAKETLKHISPEIAAIEEEKAREKDLLQKRKQDNDQFFNNFLSKKKRLGSSIRARYKVTDDAINKDMSDMATAAAKHYYKKSKNSLPVPDELGFGDDEDL